jgi:hypothetical protein
MTTPDIPTLFPTTILAPLTGVAKTVLCAIPAGFSNELFKITTSSPRVIDELKCRTTTEDEYIFKFLP